MAGVAFRRLLSAIPVLLIVSLISFGLMRLIPGDPAAAIAGIAATPAQIEQLRRDLGLDQPVWMQLLHYYEGLLRGDLGRSLLLGKGVFAATMERLPVTIGLSLYALVFTLLIGIASGIIAALRQNTWIDQAAMMFAMIGISVPNFFLGLLMIILFAVHLGWLPSGGYVPFGENPLGWLSSMTMPAFSLALLQAGLLARITRSSMLEVLRQDYIRTARAKGLPGRRVILKHALRRGGDGGAVLHPRHGPAADPGGAEPGLSDGAGGAAAGYDLPGAREHHGRCALCRARPAGAL
jgi:peptide/nickel transport system permease protein